MSNVWMLEAVATLRLWASVPIFSVEGWSHLSFVSLSSDNELLITDHRNKRLSWPSPGAALSSLNSRSVLERRMATPKMAELEYFPPKVTGS